MALADSKVVAPMSTARRRKGELDVLPKGNKIQVCRHGREVRPRSLESHDVEDAQAGTRAGVGMTRRSRPATAMIIDHKLAVRVCACNVPADTMGLVPEDFYDVSVGLKHSMAIEPEGGGNAVGMKPTDPRPGNWDTMGWGYWQ